MALASRILCLYPTFCRILFQDVVGHPEARIIRVLRTTWNKEICWLIDRSERRNVLLILFILGVCLLPSKPRHQGVLGEEELLLSGKLDLFHGIDLLDDLARHSCELECAFDNLGDDIFPMGDTQHRPVVSEDEHIATNVTDIA